MKTIIINKQTAKTLPETAGVYLYRDSQNDVIYVGKAINLKKRVSSYFLGNLETKTKHMISSAKSLSYIKVSSELEALLLEARLVKKYQPKYNSELRDDKSPLYIGITAEKYPRVLTLRQTQLNKYKLKKVYGPFISASAPRKVLKRLRKVIHFSMHKPSKRQCVYSQIGLCNPCPSEIESTQDPVIKNIAKQKYKSNITRLQRILSGQIKKVKKDLENQMFTFSDNQEFENAKKVYDQINALEYVVSDQYKDDSYLENPNLLEDIREKELNQLKTIISKYINISELKRIECFDVAHLSGTFPTASMVTFINGEPDKSLYRHYKVSDDKKNNDTDSMLSILKRRKSSFSKWGKPDLIIIDGGKGQVSAAKKAIGNEVPIVGLAKREETLIFKLDDDFKEFILPNGPAKNLVQRLRNEAHRFARRYHHNLVAKTIKSA